MPPMKNLVMPAVFAMALLPAAPIGAVPTTVGPDKPPKYETTWYTDYMVAYQKRTYDLLSQAAE